jgi:hypothetical protein
VEKQPTGRGPGGCDENGPAAAFLVGYVPPHFLAAPESESTRTIRKWSGMRPPRALPAVHFDRNERHVISGTGHSIAMH